MPSASPRIRVAALASCLVLIGTVAAGCETTQEKAEKQQARAAQILQARKERREEKKQKQKAKAKQHHKGERQK